MGLCRQEAQCARIVCSCGSDGLLFSAMKKKFDVYVTKVSQVEKYFERASF